MHVACHFLVASLLLAPLLARAQRNRSEPDFYVLSSQPGVRHYGRLTLANDKLLLLKQADGTKHKLGPQEVASFHIGKDSYLTRGGFHVDRSFDGYDVENAFVQQVDSGKVLLLKYSMRYFNGGDLLYLLQWSGQPTLTPMQGSGKEFRAALRPYLADRPDLVQQCDDKRLAIELLPKLIHALNNNLPFNSPVGR